MDNSAEILGFASGFGGLGHEPDPAGHTLNYRDFVASPDRPPV